MTFFAVLHTISTRVSSSRFFTFRSSESLASHGDTCWSGYALPTTGIVVIGSSSLVLLLVLLVLLWYCCGIAVGIAVVLLWYCCVLQPVLLLQAAVRSPGNTVVIFGSWSSPGA